jgi:hypothetical protein
VTALEHLPYSLDLVSAEVYLFPQLRSAQKARGFCDATDFIKNATKELKRLSQMASRCHKHIVTQEDYFEGNVAYIIVLFCIPQN